MLVPERFYTVRYLSEYSGINYHTLLRRLKKEDVLHIGDGPNDIIRVQGLVWLSLIEKWKHRRRT